MVLESRSLLLRTSLDSSLGDFATSLVCLDDGLDDTDLEDVSVMYTMGNLGPLKATVCRISRTAKRPNGG